MLLFRHIVHIFISKQSSGVFTKLITTKWTITGKTLKFDIKGDRLHLQSILHNFTSLGTLLIKYKAKPKFKGLAVVNNIAMVLHTWQKMFLDYLLLKENPLL